MKRVFRTLLVENMRTNIEIDDQLMTQAIAATGLKTKRAVVEEALKLLVRMRAQARIKDAFGTLTSWEGSIDEMRTDRLKDRK